MKMYPGTAEFGFLIHIGLQIIYVVKRMTNVDDRLFCNVDFSCLYAFQRFIDIFLLLRVIWCGITTPKCNNYYAYPKRSEYK